MTGFENIKPQILDLKQPDYNIKSFKFTEEEKNYLKTMDEGATKMGNDLKESWSNMWNPNYWTEERKQQLFKSSQDMVMGNIGGGMTKKLLIGLGLGTVVAGFKTTSDLMKIHNQNQIEQAIKDRINNKDFSKNTLDSIQLVQDTNKQRELKDLFNEQSLKIDEKTDIYNLPQKNQNINVDDLWDKVGQMREKPEIETNPQFYFTAPKKETLSDKTQKFLISIRDRIPFIEHSEDKARRSEALNAYPFTDEAKKFLEKSTRLKTASNLEGDDYSEENPEKIFGIPTGLSKVDIREKGLDVPAHEFIHTFQDMKGGFNYNQFNKDWEKVSNKNNLMKTIDEILANDPSYSDEMNASDVASERQAYLVEYLGTKGLKAFPQELQKYYKGILK